MEIMQEGGTELLPPQEEYLPQQEEYLPPPPQDMGGGGFGPQLGSPYMGGVAVNQDAGFMKWLFDFRKEVIVPLRHIWQGYYYDLSKEAWIEPDGGLIPLMNPTGVTWAISLIESYISPVYVVSNMDEKMMHHIMRNVIRDIWNNLCSRFVDFDLNKLDIPRVSNEIESKILAILMGARGDGYRNFFAKQYHISEVHQPGMQQQQQSGGGGFISGIKNLFKPRSLQQSFDSGYGYSSGDGYQ